MRWFYMLAVILGLTAFLGVAPGLGVEKLGVVDLQRTLNQSRAGKEAKEQFLKRVEAAQKMVDAKEMELRKLKSDLDKQGPLLSEDAQLERRKEFEKKLIDYERLKKDSEDDLNLEQRNLANKIREAIEKVVQQVGRDEGYTFIFDKNDAAIIYARDATDITDKVIRIFDAQKK